MADYNTYSIGDVVELCTETNSDLKYGLECVRGVSNTKEIQVTKANLIGRNLAPFHVVRKNEFIYNRRTSRNGERVGLGFNNTDNTYIFTEDYVHFRVKNEEQLLPDYLYLFFKRDEFDREARFNSWGSATEMFNWQDMQAIKINVPPIEEQRRIVAEYQTVERRIKNNEALIQKLEETAQAIYHHTFVEGIDENNLPEGWRKGKLEDVATIIMGQSPDGDSLNENGKGEIFYQGCTDFGYRFPSIRIYTEAPTRFAEYGDVLMSVRAPVGDLNIAPFRCAIGRGISAIREKKRRNGYIFYLLKTKEQDLKVSDGTGTVFGSINKEELHSLPIVVPTDVDIDAFQNKISIIDNCIEFYSRELTHLRTLQSLLTSKLA